ncbi:hypothetical protein ACLBKU_15610 [Erythrobacter sp. NE805]|uniref:hypothetical protein n=1 Tax=Erythrobacter sp. NE805 TaxID=3389875 RepID=UPI00396AFEAB
MASSEQIAASPEWLPNRIDARRRCVQFVRFTRAELEDRDFLANLKGQAEAWVPFAEVSTMRPAAGPARFIFHSGFCRSTLLLQALCGSGRALGLNEPEILNSLAREGEPDEELVAAILALLLRPHAGTDGVIVKPSNFPNRLIPLIMRLLPEARAVIVTNGLAEFLQAVARKGLLGRQWGRQALLTAATYAGDITRLRGQLAGFTDLQVAALGWLLMQNWFDRVHVPAVAPRLAVLHGESLTTRGPAALAGAAAHLGLTLPRREIDAILAGPVFARDAKTGEDYAALRARQAARAEVPVIAEEIAEVEAWIAALAEASGLTVPVAQTLDLALEHETLAAG